MNPEQVIEFIRAGLQAPVETWPGFSPQDIPLVVFSGGEA